MSQTPRLALPLIASGQSQKDVTHNDALLALDRMIGLAVVSDREAVPPSHPSDGATWIVPAAGEAAWGRAAGTLMHRNGEVWIAEAPRDGQVVLVADNGVLMVHAGGWQLVRRVEAAAAVEQPTGGTIIDSEARVAIMALITVLQRHAIVS